MRFGGFRNTTAQLLILSLALVGCASGTATGGASTLNCDRTGQPIGAADVAFGDGPTDDGYLLRGRAFTGVEADDMEPVIGVRVTVSGDGFSTVLCSDDKGEWGDYFSSPPPFRVTVDPASVPDGLLLRSPALDAESTFVLDEQTMYPLTVPLLFELSDESSSNSDSDSESDQNEVTEAGVCATYLKAVLDDPTLSSATELLPTDAAARVPFPLPNPDCAVETVDLNGSVAIYLGWDSGTTFDNVSAALTAGGLTAIDETGDTAGRRYVFTPPDGVEGHLLYSGNRIVPGVPAEDVLLVYVEVLNN